MGRAWMGWLLVGCTSTQEVTWYGDVEPIAAQRCARCHQPGAIAGFLDLTDGEAAQQWAQPIHAAVDSGRMPPFPATGGSCEPAGGFQNDARLTDAERAVVLEWAAGDAPLGKPGSAPPAIATDALAETSAVLTAPAPVRVPPASELADTFVCLVLDPELDQAVWLDGFEVLPDDPEVVHHVLIHRVSRAAALANDAADGTTDGTYPCFSGVNAASSLMAGWIPGAAPMRYPEGSGGVVAPDELFVAQLHYHGVMEERFDQTRFAFHWQEQTPQRPAVMTLIGNARTAAEGLQPGPNDVQGTEFVIPVGQDAHTETSFHSLPLANRTARPFMVAPHMHLVGTGLSAWIQHADGTRDCLIDVPAYDYDWQLLYFLDPENAALEVSRDDEIVVECRYDNTTNNRPWMGALRDAGLDAPIEVRLGEGTLDEMCLVGVGAVVDP